MARKKAYIEEEVIEKAMDLFWRNGYKNTSVRMLEEEMGINQFSIYASFGNKQGVFLESVKVYKKKLDSIRHKLSASQNGVIGIKQFFYDFVIFTNGKGIQKGCLVCNTVGELGEKTKPDVMIELMKFTNEIRILFVNNLKQDPNKTTEMVERQANFLMTCMLGLSLGSRILNEKQLTDYIETTFEQL